MRPDRDECTYGTESNNRNTHKKYIAKVTTLNNKKEDS